MIILFEEGPRTMPTLRQQTNVAGAITAIRVAQNLLTQQIRAATDVLKAIKLTNEYNNLNSYLSQLLHAQNSADDASFADATTALQSQTNGLEADEDAIKTIIGDVQTAATIVSYITQALTLIAKL
jgi:negative regulator of replication initiation